MGVPSMLPLPSAASDQAGHLLHQLWGHVPLWTALLFLAPMAAGTPGTPDLPKAMVHLEPPWFNVLKEDDVTLSCQGGHSSGNLSTKWFHNGNLIPTQGQPSYSFKATITDSGLYACQTDQTSLSDAVHLNVTAGWVLLQTLRQVIQDGEPLLLRCHSWKQRPLFKINFYRDSKAISYSPRNSSFFIPQANVSHSGKYHCSGFQGQMRHESHPVSITVQGGDTNRASGGSSKSSTLLVIAVVGIAAVAGAAAVLAWVCYRRHRSSGAPENRDMGETPPMEPANLTEAEEAAKEEAENTVTYSLLLHPEATEEDYQNI